MKTTFEIVTIPLNKLVASPVNVRKTGAQSIEDLAASIQAHGLIHNLVVTQKGEKHEVVAGARRFAALRKLAKDKAIAKTFPVPCRIIDGDGSTETSLAENIIRQAMHPADQFEAFRALVDQAMSLEDIAARFGVAVTTVRQRLKLANVAPRLFELYRADEINLDQLMALAVTDDHSAQERVWNSAPEWQRHPNALRRGLTETMVDAATDPRARFVGLAAYVHAGGVVERDLFQPDHQGYLTDPAKLDRLVTEKLTALAEQIKSEGWKWVEILPSAEYAYLTTFSRIHPVDVEPTPEIRAEIECLAAEQRKLEQEHQDADEFPADVDERMYEIEEQIESLNAQARTYTESQKQLAGAIVTIETVHRGLVRPTDKRKAQSLTSSANEQHEPQPDHEESGNPDDAHLSRALVEDLSAHRTAALRAVLATRPDVALVATAHSLALRICYESSYDVGSCLSLTTEKGACSLEPHAKGIETSPALVRLSELHSQWLTRIPAQAEDLWQWLLDQEQAVVLELLAFCVGQTVHAVQLPHDVRTTARFLSADHLAKAVNLDMADWWQPTAQSYLARVKKEQIIEAIAEGTTEKNFEDLRKMKKPDLVAAAERRLAESRWLPQPLRH